MSKKDERQKILMAAIECINRQGIQAITVRGIARRAGVNTAAISYYFGGKDNLLARVLKSTLKTGLAGNLEDFPEDSEDPYQTLKALFHELLGGMVNNPGIIKAHFYAPVTESKYNPELLNKFGSFLEQVAGRIKKLNPRLTGRDIEYMLMQMISAIMFPGLLPKVFGKYSKINFNNTQDRIKYIDRLFEHYLERK